MTDDRPPIAEFSAKGGGEDVLCPVAGAVFRVTVEAGVEGMIGAGLALGAGRSGERTTGAATGTVSGRSTRGSAP